MLQIIKSWFSVFNSSNQPPQKKHKGAHKDLGYFYTTPAWDKIGGPSCNISQVPANSILEIPWRLNLRVFLQSPVNHIWVNYNISLTWIKAILGWFPLLTMIIVRSQWGRYNLPRPYGITTCRSDGARRERGTSPHCCHCQLRTVGSMVDWQGHRPQFASGFYWTLSYVIGCAICIYLPYIYIYYIIILYIYYRFTIPLYKSIDINIDIDKIYIYLH